MINLENFGISSDRGTFLEHVKQNAAYVQLSYLIEGDVLYTSLHFTLNGLRWEFSTTKQRTEPTSYSIYAGGSGTTVFEKDTLVIDAIKHYQQKLREYEL